MKIVSWNVNGIRAVYKKGFLNWFEKYSPDILCLQETKAWEEQLPKELLEVPGYNVYFAEAEKKGYSGVAVYTKNKPKKVHKTLGSKDFDKEGRAIRAEYEDFVLFNIYFPNGKKNDERLNYKMGFYDEFLKKAETYRKSGKNVIVCGDVNTAHKERDLANPKQNENVSGFLPIERQWIDKFISKGYVDTFRIFNNEGENYTWWSMRTRARERNAGWRLDYFFVNEEFKPKVKDAKILSDVKGSDHCPVVLEIKD